ncbi:Hypp78 [Branchiostoma lanceolatum]|uniref:Hypp78 protein n=1 Tax=Branchiostoma lanceolatum TaxID=7740 RepID=A0A8J9VX09_BRALA|nr:Hypp78 [Branchiostoma lanceolatum]
MTTSPTGTSHAREIHGDIQKAGIRERGGFVLTNDNQSDRHGTDSTSVVEIVSAADDNQPKRPWTLTRRPTSRPHRFNLGYDFCSEATSRTDMAVKLANVAFSEDTMARSNCSGRSIKHKNGRIKFKPLSRTSPSRSLTSPSQSNLPISQPVTANGSALDVTGLLTESSALKAGNEATSRTDMAGKLAKVAFSEDAMARSNCSGRSIKHKNGEEPEFKKN